MKCGEGSGLSDPGMPASRTGILNVLTRFVFGSRIGIMSVGRWCSELSVDAVGLSALVG